MDSSKSIKPDEFFHEKETVNKIVSNLKVGPDESRVALVLFGAAKASVKVRFVEHLTAQKFQDVVQNLPQYYGKTRIDKALYLAANEIFRDARWNVSKIAVILTDGVQAAGASGLLQTSKPLRDTEVRVIAVEVGADVIRERLRLMTETDDDVVTENKVQQHLKKIFEELKKNACGKYWFSSGSGLIY